jgi:hypothetical protein
MVRVLLFLLVVIFSFSADTIAQEAEMSTELLVRYQETLPLYQELVSGEWIALLSSSVDL